MKLRNYQEAIVNSLRRKLRNNNKVIVYAPTGAGKTIISKWVISQIIGKGQTCLFTTPRIKLATQTRVKFGFGNLILGAKTKDFNSLCTIASVQSLYSRKIKKDFKYIFIDECHFAHGSKYLQYIFDNYPNSKIIGLSATPIDENGYLLSGYDDIVKVIDVSDLIADGFLTDVEVYTSKKQPDLKGVEVTNGDYNQTQASKIVRESEILTNTFQEWQRLAHDKKTIVFATDIKHAEALNDKFNSLSIPSGAVHSKMSESDIERTYERFNKDNIQILINVDMATFGFDEPSIECMLFARPIKSMRLYKQMVGRGIRTFEGKETCLMIDCANVVYDNGYPTEELVFKKKPIVNKSVDKILKIERDIDGTVKNQTLTKERVEYLEKIGKLVDLYAGKVYKSEQALVEDCRKILDRGGFYSWRQNSGKAFIEKRWVHFSTKNGVPDITVMYNYVYIGLELKLPKGKLTKHQKVTLPEFGINKVQFFIIESVIDLFECLESIKDNIIETQEGVLIKKEFFILSEQQQKYRLKYGV